MPRDREYLLDILVAARLALGYIASKTKQQFTADVQCQDALIHRLSADQAYFSFDINIDTHHYNFLYKNGPLFVLEFWNNVESRLRRRHESAEECNSGWRGLCS
jgi:hypothetical protein